MIGTSPDSIDRAEDRKRFQEVLKKLGLKQPKNATAMFRRGRGAIAADIGFPWCCGPPTFSGAEGMDIVYGQTSSTTISARPLWFRRTIPVLIDKFLE